MAKTFTTGLVITGDAGGGVRAIKSTQSELKRLNQDFSRGGQQSRKYAQDIKYSNSELTSLTNTLRPLAGIMAGVFAASTLKGQIDFADSLHKMNLRLGISTEALSEYNYVAGLSGVEFGTLSTAWQRQTRRIAEAAEGTGVAVKALDTLGLSAKELNQLKPEEQFERIAAALESIDNPGQKAALAMQLWDTEGVKLLQITNQGSAAIAAMRQEAAALGQTVSQEAATNMADFNDSLARVQALASGTTDALLAELIPGVTSTINSFTDFVKEAGGAAVVADKLTTGASVLATIYAGRLAGSITAKTAATVKGVAAEHAARLETTKRIAQDKMAEAQTARRMVAEQTAAANAARMAAQRTQLAKAEAAEQLNSIKLTQQKMAAERMLETQRLQAQTTTAARQQSLNRIAALRRQEIALVAKQEVAERTLTQATVANTSATRMQAITKLELSRTTKIADAATISSTVSTRAATAAQITMTGATRALNSAMALLGGPAGLIFLAGSALVYFTMKAPTAERATRALTQATDDYAASLNNMTAEVLRSDYTKLKREQSELTHEMAKTNLQIEKNSSEYSSGTQSIIGMSGETAKLQAKLAGLKKEKELVGGKLQALNEHHLEGIALADKSREAYAHLSGSMASLGGNVSNLRSQAEKFLQDLARINDTEIEKVNRWRQDSLAQADSFFNQSLLKRKEYEFAQVAIAEEAARRLQAIEDKRFSKYTSGGLGGLADLLRDAQDIDGAKGALIKGGVAKDIASKTFQGLPTGGGINPEFDTGFGEANRLQQEKEEMLAAYDQKIADYQNYRELELENAELYDEQLAALRESRNEQELAADQAISQAKLSGAEATFGTMASVAKTFAGEQSGLYRGLFAMEKGYALAKVAVNAPKTASDAYQAMAGIPIVGPALGVAAAAAALAYQGVQASSLQSITLAGQAHDGLNYVPNSGTWNLQKGERITGAALNRDLTQFLERENKARSGNNTGRPASAVNVSVKLIEDRSRAGQVQQQQNDDGSTDINVFLADIYGEGERAQALQAVYGLERVGR